jgi:hypothetical protein
MRANYDFEYRHECGGVAFLLDHMPLKGEVRRAKSAVHIDGKPMEPDVPMRCDACGELVGPIRTKNVVKR